MSGYMTKCKVLFILMQTIYQKQGVTPYFKTFIKSLKFPQFLLNNKLLLVTGEDILVWNDPMNATSDATEVTKNKRKV